MPPFVPGSSAAVPRALATVASGSSFKLPDMPYDYGALEPFLSGEIMKIHHTKHHQAYVTNLNVSMEKYIKAEAAGNIAEMISLQAAIRFNGGGHVNHSIFWQNLAPAGRGGGGEPEGALKSAVDARFGSFAALKTQMNAAGAGVQVSRRCNVAAVITCYSFLVLRAGLWMGVACTQQECGEPPRPPLLRQPGPCLYGPGLGAAARH